LLAFLLACCMLVMILSEARAEGPRILVIPKGVRVQHWKWVRQGAMQAGEERGAEVIFRGPRESDDYMAQLQIIKNGIEDGVDAMVIAPSHDTHAKDLLEVAAHKGIKVVIIDSDMEFEPRVSFVSSDNYQAGKRAGTYLFSLLPDGGSVILLRYMENNASTLAREQGFLDAVPPFPLSIRIIDAGYVGVSAGNGYYKTLELFREHPEAVAVFSPGEITTVGMLKAVKELGLAGKVVVVGFDYTKEIHESLATGLLQGAMIQIPYEMGYQGVMAACDAFEGKPVAKRIVTETVLVKDLEDLKAIKGIGRLQ